MLCGGKAGVKGAYIEEDEATDGAGKENQSGRKYFRILKSLDVSAEPERVKSLLENVFNNLAMRVLIESPAAPESHVESWIASLEQIPCLHFEATAEG